MNAWRELAGAKATLALSEGEVPEIAALEATLAPLRARFAANPEISRLLSHVPQTDASRASRLQEWASSRQCLILALNEALDLGAPPEQTRASLSHCDDRSIAVVAFGAASVAGVGADIERADRPMSEAATARVRTSDEAAQG